MRIVHYTTEQGVDLFQKWLDDLRDFRARVAILRRVDRMEQGNFGDCKPCSEGVSELRIDVGPGYRVYFFQHEEKVVVLLGGGDKRRQQADIKKAITSRAEYLHRIKSERDHHE
ncbi:type II toxin-antitoxin system RelE/ParE family toxin [Desulfonatronum thiodismutans]|uniref:type II toxin-antitoxin system RelE/ParE family toxin n=1 Tax=Desulfonatronum thiodismutans TaxID=159290 RepID=UPI0004ABE2B0|nr:type II toxin-antitoxin system RelE/ParE family toxin [Desulfonatronum thiodismutans]